MLTAVPAQATSGPGWHWDGSEIQADTAGAVINGVSTSSIIVTAPNVTIENSVIDCGACSNSFEVYFDVGGADNGAIQDSRITAPDASSQRGLACVEVNWQDTGVLVQGDDVSHCSTDVQFQAGNGTLRDSWLHDLGFQSGDHLNGFTDNSGGAGGLLIEHNTVLISNDQNDAVSLFGDFGPQGNATIDDNLMAGGNYTVYGGDGGAYGQVATHDIHITNNRLSTLYFSNYGQFGWLADFTPSNPGNVLSGNVDDATGAPLNY
jgi:hypothetical protein